MEKGITITVRQEQERTFSFNDETEITIGRVKENLICVEDNACSRFHCAILFENDAYILKDLGSYNGTKVNGEKITVCPLSHDDEIEIGKTQIVFCLAHPPENIQVKKRKKKAPFRKGRKREAPVGIAGYLIFFSLLLVVLCIAFKLYNDRQTQKEYQEYYNLGVSLEKSGKYEEALRVYQKIKDDLPDQEMGQKAWLAFQKLNEILKHRVRVTSLYEKIVQDYRDKKLAPLDYLEELGKFRKNFPDAGFDQEIAIQMQLAQKAHEDREKEKAVSDRPPVSEEKSTSKDDPKTENKGTPKPEDESRHALTPEERRWLQKGEWERVIASHSGRGSGAEYLEDLKNVVWLEEEFFKAIENRKLGDLEIEVAERKGKIVEVRDKKLFIEVGKDARIGLAWHTLAPGIRHGLLQKLPFSQRGALALATYATSFEWPEKADEILLSLLEKEPHSRPQIERHLARWRGYPGGIFGVHEGRIVTPEGKLLRECQKKVERICRSDSVGSGLDEIFLSISRMDEGLQKKIREMVLQELSSCRKRCLENIKSGMDSLTPQYMNELKNELERRRASALAFISDSTVYRKQEGSVEGQEEANRRIAAVVEIWETPSKGMENVFPALLQAKRKIQEIEGVLLKHIPESKTEWESSQYMEFLDGFATRFLTVRSFSQREQERKRIVYNQKIMEENQAVKGVEEGEREQVRITNEYRNMMGLHALKIRESLVLAARRHSDFMRKTGRFDHVVPGAPEGATPEERARNAGYSGPVGENIYMGSDSSPLSAHNSWIQSPDHHRNILRRKWRSMGAGVSGNYWTQNYGEK